MNDSYSYNGRTERDIRIEAFNRVMSGVALPEPARAALFNACLTCLNYRELEKTAINILSSTSWIWFELDKWRVIFRERKKFPGTWDECLYQDPLPIPTTISKALAIFSFKQKRAILKDVGIRIKPAPRTIFEVDDTFKKYIKIEVLKPFIENRYPEYIKEYYEYSEKVKCSLLLNDIETLFTNLRRYYQSLEYIQDVKPRKYKSYVEVDGVFACSIAREYARKYNKKEITDIPPFFPGCLGRFRFDPT